MQNDRNNRNNRGDRNIDPEEKQYDERVVQIDRVARVVKGGRRFHFRALAAVGDHAGKVGVGVAKGADVTTAVTKAISNAKKNFLKISLYNDTIPHEAQSKVGGAVILIKPAAPGTGLIAGGVVRTILEVVGVRNALSKSLGSSNKINAAYATIEALKSIEPISKWNMKPAKKVTSEPKSAAKPEKASEPAKAEEPKEEVVKEPVAKPKKAPAAKTAAKPAKKAATKGTKK
jgi:small subunit ribosomal protein S5